MCSSSKLFITLIFIIILMGRKRLHKDLGKCTQTCKYASIVMSHCLFLYQVYDDPESETEEEKTVQMIDSSLDELEVYLRLRHITPVWLYLRFQQETRVIVNYMTANGVHQTPAISAAFSRLVRGHNYESIVTYGPDSPFYLGSR